MMYIEGQYPDTLIREDGTELPCRFVPRNSGSGLRKMVDGKEIEVNYTVAMPVDSPTLLFQEEVTGVDKTGFTMAYKVPVVLFHRGEFHCVAYL